jgi:hypothetical protein
VREHRSIPAPVIGLGGAGLARAPLCKQPLPMLDQALFRIVAAGSAIRESGARQYLCAPAHLVDIDLERGKASTQTSVGVKPMVGLCSPALPQHRSCRREQGSIR